MRMSRKAALISGGGATSSMKLAPGDSINLNMPGRVLLLFAADAANNSSWAWTVINYEQAKTGSSWTYSGSGSVSNISITKSADSGSVAVSLSSSAANSVNLLAIM